MFIPIPNPIAIPIPSAIAIPILWQQLFGILVVAIGAGSLQIAFCGQPTGEQVILAN